MRKQWIPAPFLRFFKTGLGNNKAIDQQLATLNTLVNTVICMYFQTGGACHVLNTVSLLNGALIRTLGTETVQQ